MRKRKLVTDIKNNGFEEHVLRFSPKFLGRSPPRIWGFRNAGPGVVAVYCGPAGGPVLERCELLPGHLVELHAAHFVVQSRDSLGAVVFIATA
jgi:hypothetical protein